jgi:class 3 adenylate cyclase
MSPMRLAPAIYVIVIATAFALATSVTWLVDRNNNTLAGLLDALFVATGIGALELVAWRRRRLSDRPTPEGAVTFLFTDIEGSTRLLREVGPGYRTVLDRHSSILHAAIFGHHGRVIDTQGDSVFAAFAHPGEAVAAALDAQRALAATDWPHGQPVLVRMGVHTGPATRAGDRYVGLAVHRVARTAALARGGQVVLSETTYRLLEDEEGDHLGMQFEDLGEHSLKDYERSVRLYRASRLGEPK